LDYGQLDKLVDLNSWLCGMVMKSLIEPLT